MMHTCILIFISFSLCWFAIDTSKDIVIVILSQPNKYHVKLANNLEFDIRIQAKVLNKQQPIIHKSHKDFPHVGSWTITPLIPKLSQMHGKNSSWIFFVEDRTIIKLENMIEMLNKYNSRNELFIGYALHDNEASIIHHFAFFERPEIFKYPNTASGFFISTSLINKLSLRLKTYDLQHDFSIDYAHELSLFIWDKGNGTLLNHESTICVENNEQCVSYPEINQFCATETPKDAIYFAVKTCEKFHLSRIPVVKNTWGKYATRIKYFSDVGDQNIPTINLGFPNTEHGHCGKTLGIIKYLAKELIDFPEINWVVIADDDTLLSLPLLQELLSCYDAHTTIALGERYGFDVHTTQGYNYLTGGSGMVFSRPLLMKLAIPGACECPTLSSPDDMYLGVCLAKLQVSVTHSPSFHQARPKDYSSDYLKSHKSISFHKHWMIDPLKVYEVWFEKYDTHGPKKNIKHTEL